MILTLEVNENHNINRLITGSALLATNKEAAQEPSAQSFYENLAAYHSQEETQVDVIAKEIKGKETNQNPPCNDYNYAKNKWKYEFTWHQCTAFDDI